MMNNKKTLSDLRVEYNEIPKGTFISRNFFTPQILGYYANRNIYAEISSSTNATIPTGSIFDKMFGVTFTKVDGDKIIRLFDESGATYTLEDAYKKAEDLLL